MIHAQKNFSTPRKTSGDSLSGFEKIGIPGCPPVLGGRVYNF